MFLDQGVLVKTCAWQVVRWELTDAAGDMWAWEAHYAEPRYWGLNTQQHVYSKLREKRGRWENNGEGGKRGASVCVWIRCWVKYISENSAPTEKERKLLHGGQVLSEVESRKCPLTINSSHSFLHHRTPLKVDHIHTIWHLISAACHYRL